MGKTYIIIVIFFITTFVSTVRHERYDNIDVIDVIDDKTDSLRNELSILRNESNDLERKWRSLQDQKKTLENIERLQYEIKNEEKKRDSLNMELARISEREDAIKREKDSLDRIEDGIVMGIIRENSVRLEVPFSQMSFGDLSRIREKCQKYSYNSKIKEFLDKVGNNENNKRVHDRMMTILNSPYDKLKIGEALSEAEGMKGMSDAQQKEVDEGKELLLRFPDGLKAFGEFLRNLNGRREPYGGNYIWLDFLHDRGDIINDNLQERIDSCLLTVPYLYERYNTFMEELQNAPGEHSDIEREILELCETIDK